VDINEVIIVQRDPDSVWTLFQDIEGLAQCLPGAELTEDKGDGAYAGKVVVKLGPMTATFEGEANVTTDHENRTGNVEGRGVDRRGGSRGQVKVTYSVAEHEEGSQVTIDAGVTLSGAAAQFGRTGIIKEMSKRLLGEFVGCVEAKLAATTQEEAAEVSAGEVGGIGLFFVSLLSSIGKFFRRLFGRK
jgi:carbon monoxide dehydrogenase subunit G